MFLTTPFFFLELAYLWFIFAEPFAKMVEDILFLFEGTSAWNKKHYLETIL